MSGERRVHHVERRESVFHQPLLAVAHGSRDPRSAATVHRLLDEVRAQAPGLDARAAFLDLSEPSVPDALAALHADGHREVAVVPLLLGSAYHARVDLPELLAEAAFQLPRLTVHVTDVLGPDPLLQAAAEARLAEAGVGPGPEVGVVLTGVGSSDASANATVARVAARWAATGEYAAVTHAFATCGPTVAAAIARVRAMGAARVAVAPWFLAPGLLLDRVAVQATAASADVTVAAPLAEHAAVAEVVLSRYAEATALPRAA